jgi:hypothetical protein
MEGSGLQIFVDANFLYAFQSGGAGWSSLHRIPRGGGEPVRIVDVSPFGRGLAFCGDRLVWSYADEGSRTMTTLDSFASNAKRQFAEGQLEPSDVVGDGTWVYWTSDLATSDGSSRVIRRSRCDGGAIVDIATVKLPIHLVAAPGLLAWADASRIALRREGSAPSSIDASDVVGLATDGADVFWLEGKNPTTLRSTTAIVATDLDGARDLAASPTMLCWSEPGSVLCMNRTPPSAPSIVARSEWGDEQYIPFALTANAVYAYVDRNIVTIRPPLPPPAPPVAPSGGRPFDANAAQIMLRQIEIEPCLVPNGPRGTGVLGIVFEPNGVPSALELQPPYKGTSVGACLLDRYRGARVPPFHGRPKTLKHVFAL